MAKFATASARAMRRAQKGSEVPRPRRGLPGKTPRPPQNTEGYFSGKFLPQKSFRGDAEAAQALANGFIVVELQGQFTRIPMGQRIAFKELVHDSTWGRRYTEYSKARTVGEMLKLGAGPDDVYYDFKKEHASFVEPLRTKRARGPLPRSKWPKGVKVLNRKRPFWLPKDWAMGVKTTCASFLPAFIAPNARCYYHRPTIEKIIQHQLGPSQGPEGARDWSRICLASGKTWDGRPVAFSPDERLFACLSSEERAQLPPAEALHFSVISARRAGDKWGIRGITNVQTQLLVGGAKPVWYVDAESLDAYKKLGLKAVAGGKLTPSRNLALEDAEKRKRACVQISDDISRWEYFKGDIRQLKDESVDYSTRCLSRLQEANARAKSTDGRHRLIISPVAAARFLLAKLRAAARPRLGGVFPCGNPAFGMLHDAVTTDGFILGDFFVHDRSPCRFDEAITLKEDYDFTCAHLQRHGAVHRCNRIIIHVAHERNAGGAVDVRDSKGEKERRNIKILMRKWPGVFRHHGLRGDTQVLMRWSKRTRA